MNRPAWLISATCVVASYLLITFSHFTVGELTLDEAMSFFMAVPPLRDVLTLSVTSQGHPPLFFIALHEWLRLGDTEPVMRLLPLLFMVCAAITLLRTPRLTPLARIVATAVLLLSGFSSYLTPTLRPYSLGVWFSLWSCLSFASLISGPRHGVMPYVWYVVATVLLAYSQPPAVWTLLAQGIYALAAVAFTAVTADPRRAIHRHAPLLLSLAVVAVLSLPLAIGVLQFQSALERPAIWVTLAAMVNPRYYISGPVYLLAMPAGLGYLAVGLAVVGVWRGVRDRDPFIAVLATVIAVQIGGAHGFLAGRTGFSFRYLAPAFPALCMLVGLGADRCLAGGRWAQVAVTACAAGILVAATFSFVRAPHDAPTGPWRTVAAELRRMPGTKLVFFDIGWDTQRLRYEVRHDPDIRMLANEGPAWGSFGQPMTSEYVTRTIDRDAGSGTTFFYHLDAVLRSRVFDEAFVPGMMRHGCTRVYQRDVPTYVRDVPGNEGALLLGYACRGD